MRKPNPIIVLLCIFLSCTCNDKRTDSSISLDERKLKECFCGWSSSSSLLVSVFGDVTFCMHKTIVCRYDVNSTYVKSVVCGYDVRETEQARTTCMLIANQNRVGDTIYIN